MRGRGIGSYTLGDQYISPDRRMSQMLMEGSTRKGKPAHHWSDTLGRIAQQLAGGYLAGRDQKQQDAYLDTIGKTEPGSFRPPTDAEAMAAPGMRDLELATMTGMAGDGQGQTVTSPLPDDQLMGRGDIPSIMEKIGRYNQNMGAPGASDDQTLQQGLDLQSQKFSQAMNQSREASNVPRPRDFKAEMAQGMQDYQQDPNNRIMNDKMPQRDFMIKNLQAMPNNTYAKRGLAQALMLRMDQDHEAGLANKARSQQLEDIENAQGFKSGESALNRGATLNAATLKAGEPVNAIKEYQQAVQNGLFNGSYTDYLQTKSVKMLTPLQEAQLKETNLKIESTEKGQESAIESLRRTIRTGKQLLVHPGREWATGGTSWTSNIPGTHAKGFAANLDTFKSQNFLPAVAQMKGAGALSDAEGKKLTDAIGALDAGMPQDEFKASLAQIIADLEAAEKRMPGYSANGNDGGSQKRRSGDNQGQRKGDLPLGFTKD